MKLNSFYEAVTDYERLTNGEKFEWNAGYENLKVLPTNEFMTWRIGEKDGIRYFEIRQTYARSFSNFVPFIKEIMEKEKLEWIVTTTQRDPKGHIRKWSMVRLPEYDYTHEGRRYFVLKGHISNLR